MDIITSRKNQIAVHMKKLGADANYRRQSGLFLCQGGKLYEEALNSGANIKEVLYCGEKPEVLSGAAYYEAAKEILEYVSPMQSAPELLFSCLMPSCDQVPDRGRIVILEDIQDPGNAGTIMRTASAFGFSSLVLIGDCADPYNPKTIRASMGAVFKMHLYKMDMGEIVKLGVPVYAAALSSSALELRKFEFPDDFALAIGNEGHGLSEEMLNIATKTVKIPMEAGNESLNAAVAAAVLMWEAYR